MSKILNLSFSRIFVLAFVALLFSVTATVGYGNEPRQSRVLSRASHPFEPIEIESIKVQGNRIYFGEPIGNGKDWLQGLTVRVKNISEKPISYISIELWSYPPESGDKPRVTSFSRGPLPLPRNGVLEPPKAIVAPGEFIDITFTDDMYKMYQEYLQVSDIKLSVGNVFFMDDTLWMEGVTFTRDPDKPTRWKPVQSSVKRVEEFYLQKKTQSLVQPPGKLVNHTFPTARPVALKLRTKSPPSKARYDCRASADSEFMVCDYDCDAFFNTYSPPLEYGRWDYYEVFTNCSGTTYCYPYQTKLAKRLCFL